jgi:hypothetical protein
MGLRNLRCWCGWSLRRQGPSSAPPRPARRTLEISRITCLTKWVKPPEVGVFGNTAIGLSNPTIPFHYLSTKFIQGFRFRKTVFRELSVRRICLQ